MCVSNKCICFLAAGPHLVVLSLESSEGVAEEHREDSSRNILQGTGGRSCPNSSRGTDLQIQASSMPRTFQHSSVMWTLLTDLLLTSPAVVCSFCLQHINHGNSTSHLGSKCMRKHITLHHRAWWEQHHNETSGKRHSSFWFSLSVSHSPSNHPQHFSSASTTTSVAFSDREGGLQVVSEA